MTNWADYDPDRAKQLLDEIGLVDRDGAIHDLGTHSKERIAGMILDRVIALVSRRVVSG